MSRNTENKTSAQYAKVGKIRAAKAVKEAKVGTQYFMGGTASSKRGDE